MGNKESNTKLWAKGWFKNLMFFLFICIAFFTGVPQWAHLKVRQLLLPQLEIHEEMGNNESLYSLHWALIDTTGKEIPISQFVGKPMVISFWADWCMPCLAEMPSLEALQDSLSGTDVEFAMVTGEPQDNIKNFLKDNPVSLPVYFMENGWPQLLAHKGIPATFLIDSGGKLVFHRVGAADWDEKGTVSRIRELLLFEKRAI